MPICWAERALQVLPFPDLLGGKTSAVDGLQADGTVTVERHGCHSARIEGLTGQRVGCHRWPPTQIRHWAPAAAYITADGSSAVTLRSVGSSDQGPLYSRTQWSRLHQPVRCAVSARGAASGMTRRLDALPGSVRDPAGHS
jgi:hypothetical protein